MMVEILTHALKRAIEQSEIDHHAGLGIGRSTNHDFGPVGMAMDAAAAFGLDRPFQRMSGLEPKLLTQFEHQGMPINLCVWRLSRHLGCARQKATEATVFAARDGPSI